MNNEAQFTNEIVNAELVSGPAATAGNQRQVGVSLVERILRPQNLQWMMISGGGLLVIGFAIWLWSIGVFENPIIVASTVGVINLSLLGVGIWLSEGTRYKIAGRGLTLLSSLVLPLNLWLYDSQGLISLEAGGQLWIPALVCCIIYAMVARITRDSMFVYTLVGGVVLTGMLFLAGAPGGVFWTVLPMSTFLIVVGAICVHADAWFLESESEFSRDKFGIAFFRAGHLVLISGLALLFGGQFASTATDLFLSDWGMSIQSPNILFNSQGKLWTLAILLGAGYTYIYSNLTKRRSHIFTALIVIVGTWFTVCALNLLNIQLTIDLGLMLFGIMVVGVNVFTEFVKNRQTEEQTADRSHVLLISLVALALISIGLARYVFAVSTGSLFVSWVQVAQLLSAATAVLTLPGLWRDQGLRRDATTYIAAGTVGLMVAFVSALFGFSFTTVPTLLIVCAAIPLAISLVALISRQHRLNEQFCLVATSMAAALIGLWIVLLINSGFGVSFASLTSIGMMVVLAGSFAIAGYVSGQRVAIAAGITAMATTVTQVFIYFHWTSPYVVILTVSIFGLVMLAASKLIRANIVADDDSDSTQQQLVLFLSRFANSTVITGAAASILFSVFSIFEGQPEIAQFGLLAFQLTSLGIATLVVKQKEWKQGFVATGFATIGTGIIVLATISELSMFQRIEVASLVLGAVMVVAGYIGWSREGSQTNESVTFSFFFGSLLLAVPMIYGVLFDRIDGGEIFYAWRCLHEIGGLIVGLLLLGSGILCRVRSTTLSGGVLLAVYVVSNLLLIEFPEQLQNTSVLMMIGGATFFGLAVLLSVYRDRLISLPEKVRSGKGVFSVLKWR